MRSRIPFFQKCEAKCSRFTPKLSSNRSPVSGKRCSVAVRFCLHWWPVAVHFYGNGCKYVIKKFELVPDGGTPGCFGAKIWRFCLTKVGQVSGIRKTLVWVRTFPGSPGRDRRTLSCGSGRLALLDTLNLRAKFLAYGYYAGSANLLTTRNRG